MFLRKIFFIAVVVAFFQAPVLSADCENPAHKNVVQLLEQGQKLAEDKQLVSAISKYNKALEELNRVSSYTVESRLEYSIVNALAEAYLGLCESKTAESYYNRALHFEYIKPKEGHV